MKFYYKFISTVLTTILCVSPKVVLADEFDDMAEYAINGVLGKEKVFKTPTFKNCLNMGVGRFVDKTIKLDIENNDYLKVIESKLVNLLKGPLNSDDDKTLCIRAQSLLESIKGLYENSIEKEFLKNNSDYGFLVLNWNLAPDVIDMLSKQWRLYGGGQALDFKKTFCKGFFPEAKVPLKKDALEIINSVGDRWEDFKFCQLLGELFTNVVSYLCEVDNIEGIRCNSIAAFSTESSSNPCNKIHILLTYSKPNNKSIYINKNFEQRAKILYASALDTSDRYTPQILEELYNNYADYLLLGTERGLLPEILLKNKFFFINKYGTIPGVKGITSWNEFYLIS